MNKLNGIHYLELSRLDAPCIRIFDEQGLIEESMPRASRTDAEFLRREGEHMACVRQFQQHILQFLGLPNVKHLPAPAVTEPMKARFLQTIRRDAANGFKQYQNSTAIATLCYAALLLERDDIGRKTRKEFSDSNNRNVFGDTQLVQDALWLKAHIFSEDRAVKRMVDYIGLPEITVVSKIENPVFRVFWFRLLKSVRIAFAKLAKGH